MKRILLFPILLVFLFGCSAQNVLENLSKLEFKIDSVTDFEILEIPISGKSSIGDFSPSELLKIVPSFSSGNLQASFTLNVSVKNPNTNDGASDYLKLEITSLPWEFYFNDKNILKGNISEPIKLHGNSPDKIIPIKIYLIVFEIVNKNNINELLKTVLNYGGQNPNTSKISLYAKPTVGTILGNIPYKRIKIVDYKFSSK
ncbi:MAG: hypothetical protein PF445_03825 [Melioribacteraceae bacterium]|jgi:LEA14-like dessication related protein|nr:hypothetical protein [Melioribacteraceae bacterium]